MTPASTAILAVLASCGTALAQDIKDPMATYPVDVEQLFADHAAQVERIDGKERLVMPGGVEIWRNADGSVFATDTSQGGAVGCALMIFSEILALARACGDGSETDHAALQSGYDRIVAFAAANAYPPVPEDSLRQRLTRSAPDPATLAAQCESARTDGLFEVMLPALVQAGKDPAGLDDLLSVPRLPVSNPCL